MAVPPAGVNFVAFETRFATTWAIRAGSALTMTGCGGELHVDAQPALFDVRAVVLDGLTDDLAQVEGGPLQRDLVAGDPRDVEEVVHHAGQVLDLPFDGLAGAEPTPGYRPGCARARRASMRMAASGFRSSCDSTAMKSLFRRSAS